MRVVAGLRKSGSTNEEASERGVHYSKGTSVHNDEDAEKAREGESVYAMRCTATRRDEGPALVSCAPLT